MHALCHPKGAIFHIHALTTSSEMCFPSSLRKAGSILRAKTGTVDYTEMEEGEFLSIFYRYFADRMTEMKSDDWIGHGQERALIRDRKRTALMETSVTTSPANAIPG